MNTTTTVKKQVKFDAFIEREALEYIAASLPTFQIISLNPIDGTDIFDAVISSGETNNRFEAKAEIKVKSCSIARFEKEGAVIQREKYFGLCAEAYKNCSVPCPLYINIYPDGVAIWNLHEVIPSKWVVVEYRKNNLPDSPIEKKTVGNLHFNDCIEYKRLNVPLCKFRLKAIEYFK